MIINAFHQVSKPVHFMYPSFIQPQNLALMCFSHVPHHLATEADHKPIIRKSLNYTIICFTLSFILILITQLKNLILSHPTHLFLLDNTPNYQNYILPVPRQPAPEPVQLKLHTFLIGQAGNFHSVNRFNKNSISSYHIIFFKCTREIDLLHFITYMSSIVHIVIQISNICFVIICKLYARSMKPH